VDSISCVLKQNGLEGLRVIELSHFFVHRWVDERVGDTEVLAESHHLLACNGVRVTLGGLVVSTKDVNEIVGWLAVELPGYGVVLEETARARSVFLNALIM
jgi:hypothetical protein